MLIIPRATEKAYHEQTKRTYIFEAPLEASKQAIGTAVSEQFGVTVTDVRTQVRKGKPTRFSRGKRAYPGTTHRRDHKFAYVTLKDGDSIKVFEEVADTANTADAKPEESKERKGLLGRRAKADKAEQTDQADKSEGEQV